MFEVFVMRSLCTTSTRLEQRDLVLLLVDVLAIVRDLLECELAKKRRQTRAVFVSERALRFLGSVGDFHTDLRPRLYFYFARRRLFIFILLIMNIFDYASASHTQFLNFMFLGGLYGR